MHCVSRNKQEKTGNAFIDDQLDNELAAMDDLNATFEDHLAQQRADHERLDIEPGVVLEPQASESLTPYDSESVSSKQRPNQAFSQGMAPHSESAPPMSEEEQWKIIQKN